MSKKLIAAFLSASFIWLAGCADKNAQPNASPASPTPSKPDKAKAEVTTEPHWDQVSPGVSLQVKVEKGVDSSNSTPDSPRYKYDVNVNLKNTGSSPIIYDTIEAAFLPGEGEPLRMRTIEGIHQDGRYAAITSYSRGGEQFKEVNDLQKRAVLRIGKSKTEKWSYDTGGDTNDLLSRSQAAPLIFEFALRSNKRAVAGPFQAALPDLDSLSTAMPGAPPQAVYLKFKPYGGPPKEATAR